MRKAVVLHVVVNEHSLGSMDAAAVQLDQILMVDLGD